MTKKGKMKLGAGIVAIVAVVAVLAVSTGGALFQGRMLMKTSTKTLQKLYPVASKVDPAIANKAWDSMISRAELAKAVVVGKDLPLVTPPATPTFSDVSQESWYYIYIETLAANGYVDTSRNTYLPASKVSRAEAVKLIALVWEVDLLSPTTQTFTDVKGEDWYSAYIESLYSKLGNDLCAETCQDGKFYPATNATKTWVKAVIDKL